MPPNTISLEIDLNTDDLTKETVRAKTQLESITTQVKALRNSLKDNQKEQAAVAKEMKNLSDSGQENTQRFRDLSKASESLKKTESERRVELEQNIAAQQVQRKEYGTLSKALTAYTAASEKEFTINRAKGGSIEQIKNALNQNRLAYQNLSEEERNSAEVGGELLKTIQQQDTELKGLSDTIGLHQLRVGDYRSQIKLAVDDLKNQEEKLKDLKREHRDSRGLIQRVEIEQAKLTKAGKEGTKEYQNATREITRLREKQDRLGKSIDSTETQIKEQTEALSDQRKELAQAEKETAKNTLEQTKFTGVIGNSINAFKALRAGLPRVATAFKTFGRVLLANPIYLIAAVVAGVIAAFVGLIRIFSGTQKAQDRIKTSTAGIKGAFEALIGILQRVGGFLVSVFSQPQKILQAYLNVVKQVFNFYKNILTLNFSGLKDQFQGLADGALNIFKRLRGAAKEVSDATREGIRAGREVAENEIRLRDLRTDNLTTLAKLRVELEEQNTIIGTAGLSEQERLAAADEQTRIAKEINRLKGEELDLEIQILETKFSLNDTSAEEARQLEDLRAKRIELDSVETKTVRAGEKLRTKIKVTEEKAREKAHAARLAAEAKQEQAYQNQRQSIQDKIRALEDDAALKALETQEERDEFRLNRELERIIEGINNLDIAEQQKSQLILNAEEYRQAQLDRIQKQADERREEERLKREEEETQRQEQEEQRLEEQRLADEENARIAADRKLDDERRYQDDRIKLIGQTSAFFGEVLGQESKVFQAVSLAKRAFIIADQIAQAKAAIADATRAAGKATQTGAQAVADAQAGALETGKSAPFPFNLGLIAGYFATVLPIVANVIAAVRQAKQFAQAQKQTATFERGGVIPIGGKRHSQGGTRFYGDDGTTFEAERGEAVIINRGATKQFLPYLSQLNQAHGGLPLYRRSSYLQGGGVVSPQPIIDTDELAIKIGERVLEGVRQIPSPVVSVEDINSVQTNVSVLSSRAEL